MRTTVRFDKVAIKGVRRWVDDNGKKRQQTKEFWQTVNPFNRGPDGQPKTSDQILMELKVERDRWLSAHDERKS